MPVFTLVLVRAASDWHTRGWSQKVRNHLRQNQPEGRLQLGRGQGRKRPRQLSTRLWCQGLAGQRRLHAHRCQLLMQVVQERHQP